MRQTQALPLGPWVGAAWDQRHKLTPKGPPLGPPHPALGSGLTGPDAWKVECGSQGYQGN